MALAQQLMPPLKELALDTTTGFGRAWATAFCAMGSAAAPNITARLLRLMSFIEVTPSAWGGYNGRPPGPNANGARIYAKDFTLCHTPTGRE